MKKGLAFIDWSISVGIFLIYLVALFVFVSPALTQDYSEEYLKEIAQTGFESQTYHTIQKYPILIKQDGAELLDTVVHLTPPSNLNFESDNIGFFYENFNEIDAEVGYSYVYMLVSLTGGGTTDKFIMVISDEFTQQHSYPSGIEPDYHAFGVPESFTGLSERKFVTNLRDYTYDEIKAKINYPSNKNLNITIYNTTTGEIVKDSVNGLELTIGPTQLTPSQQVYVIEWSDWLINRNSNKELVKVKIQTW